MLNWVFALDEAAAGWFSDMVMAAVISAKQHTELTPVCLFDGSPNTLTDWLLSQGVRVHYVAVPFKGELFSNEVLGANALSGYKPNHAAGAFLKICASRYVESEVYLLTDCDVIFVNEVPYQSVQTIAAALEPHVSERVFNSGVMLINAEYYLSQEPSIIDFLRQANFFDRENSSYDQTLLNKYFQQEGWAVLPATMNWRPFQGINENASIVHFHGPKPIWIKEMIRGVVPTGGEAMYKLFLKSPGAMGYYTGIFDSLLLRS